MKNINMYEKEITIVSMWASLKNNIIRIMCFVFVFICFGFVYTNATPKKYKTTGQLANKTVITSAVLNTISGAFKSDAVLETTVSYFLENGISHKNGSAITMMEISSSLVIPASNNSCYLQVSLVSSDSSWIKEGLSVLFNQTITTLENGEYSNNFSSLRIASKPSNPIDISNSNKKMMFFIMGGIVLGLVVPFLFDLKYDLINDIVDVKTLCGNNVIELSYRNKRKVKNENE